MSTQQPSNVLPDVTVQTNSPDSASLQWVGMEQIGLPTFVLLSNGEKIAVNAKVDIFVSLDSPVKGIHMSRLYMGLNERLANQTVSPESLKHLLNEVLSSQKGISQSAMIKLSFDLPLNKKALITENAGYQSYTVVIKQQLLGDKSEISLDLTIPYSSTCPCSASLANQLNIEAIAEQFPGDTLSKEQLFDWLRSSESHIATPHNQRSYAYVNMHFTELADFELDSFIYQIENAIGTPVQTAVKRADEQAFARLNGSNLMFCEDAARRVKRYLEGLTNVADYWFKVEHQESLHAHNAVVIDSSQTN